MTLLDLRSTASVPDGCGVSRGKAGDFLNKICILTVAPYPEFGELAEEVARQYPQIDMYLAPGIYQSAIEYTQTYPSKKFDVIISRSFTADLLRSSSITPVIGVEVSAYDVLRTLQLANSLRQPFAVLSTPPVIETYRRLAELLGLSLHLYTFYHVSQVEGLLREIKEKGFDYVIAGIVAENLAPPIGLKTIRITSSRESIQSAIQQALAFHQCVENVRQTDGLYQTFLDQSKDGIIIFNQAGKAVYANIAVRNKSLLSTEEHIVRYIDTLERESHLSVVKRIDDFYWEIEGHRIPGENVFYCFRLRKLYSISQKTSFIHLDNADNIFQGISNVIWNGAYRSCLEKVVQSAIDTHIPVLITGEIGTGKAELAQYIYCHSVRSKTPLITINCKSVTKKSWDTVVNNYRNPIHDVGGSVLLERIDLLEPAMQSTLAEYIINTNMGRRHRLYATSCADLSRLVVERGFSISLYRCLRGLHISPKPLSQLTELIPLLAGELLEWNGKNLSGSAIAFEPSAMAQLQAFSWPLNILQLNDVVQQLVLACKTTLISGELTAEILSAIPAEGAQSAQAIDLSKSLREIERDVIFAVLRQEQMNQSAAAKRLGIGRSTLWRKLGQ